jgi:anti-anti-sigma factor
MVERRNGADVLLDMAQVNYLNSSNIARMLKLRKVLASDHPGRLIISGVHTSIWGVFLVTGLDKIFELADDVPTGLAMLQIEPGDSDEAQKPKADA